MPNTGANTTTTETEKLKHPIFYTCLFRRKQCGFEVRREGSHSKGENDGSKERWVNCKEPSRWQGGRCTMQKDLILMKRIHFPVPVKSEEIWICAYIQRPWCFGRMEGPSIKSCQQNHFLLSKMLNVIFHNFHHGAIISYCSDCLQELHQRESRQSWFSLGRLPTSCCHVILQQFQK